MWMPGSRPLSVTRSPQVQWQHASVSCRASLPSCTIRGPSPSPPFGSRAITFWSASRQFWSKNVRYLVQFAGHLTQESFLGYGGSSRHSRHHSGEDRRLCVMPHAVPSPCGRVGVAPPPRPSVDDAAYEDRLMALRCLVPSQDLDGPTCRGRQQSVLGLVVLVSDQTARTR